MQEHSVLFPFSPKAEAIANLGWLMFFGAAGIIVLVAVLTGYACFSGKRARRLLGSDAFILVGGGVFPAISLAVLLVYGLLLTASPKGQFEDSTLRIQVTGEQWWWRVHYLGLDASNVATANEIYVPVGRPVTLDLLSADVIHSFWVPALAGKVDMIPGVTNRLLLQTDHVGVYRGQCAEYCGGPHAHMAFTIIAVEPEEFDRWLMLQGQPAAPPTSLMRQNGEALFMSVGCSGCHAIRGTMADGMIGPDLTHVGGRLSIGADTLPTDASSFGQWIRNNQHHKPNNRMPSFENLSGSEIAALSSYLESLR